MKGLADFLERPGGEILAGFALLTLGLVLHAEDIRTAGVTIIARGMVSVSRSPVATPLRTVE